MATLGRGSLWQLQAPLNAYPHPQAQGLATQVAAGRQLRLLDTVASAGRRAARLHGDGYPCWLSEEDLRRHATAISALTPLPRLDRTGIAARLPQVLAFTEAAQARPNRYLWGGTLGPDYDCSGLVQAAYGAAGIWLPRDAYLQERFCRPVAVQPGDTGLLRPGDLLFFGSAQRCTHVALHLGDGIYRHSSGESHGRNGIGLDNLNPHNSDPVACHYRRTLRGAGRVMHSHDGRPSPD